MRNKFLFFVPSPRDIPEVKQPIVDLLYQKHDVLWLKYYPELEAYQAARTYFLNSPEKYDYFCILPDDMAINKDGLHQLFKEIENPSIDLSPYPFGDGKNYPVLSGICNFSYLSPEQMERTVCSISSVTSQYLLDFKDLDEMTDRVIKVAFVGFSCTFIHRSVLQKINFERIPDLGLDSSLADALIKRKIPQFMLKTARFVHYKGLSVNHRTALSVNPDVIFTGVYKPHVIFVPKEKAK